MRAFGQSKDVQALVDLARIGIRRRVRPGLRALGMAGSGLRRLTAIPLGRGPVSTAPAYAHPRIRVPFYLVGIFVLSVASATILAAVSHAQPQSDGEDESRQSCPVGIPAPSGLEAEGGDRRIDVSWDAVDLGSTVFSAEYFVVVSGTGGGSTTTSSTSAAFTGLTNRESYSVSVQTKAVGDFGAECYGSSASTTATPEAPPTPDPAVFISGLVTMMVKGGSDSFTVSASDLLTYNSYTIEVTASDNDIGFNSSCTSLSDSENTSTKATAYTATFTLHGCRVGSGTVTAKLKQGSSTLDTASQSVTVEMRPVTPEPPCDRYDANGDGEISRQELVTAIRDYLDDIIDRDELDEVIECYCADNPPSQVQSLEAEAVAGGIDASWQAPSTCAATHYEVQHKLSSASWPNPPGTNNGTSLTWTPSLSAGTYDVRVRACNDAGCGVWSTVNGIIVQPPPPPVLSLPDVGNSNATAGQAFSRPLPAASGGTPPYTYSATGLPPGLTFVSSTRTISGTPTTAGTYEVEYSVGDDGNGTASSEFNITVAPRPTSPTAPSPGRPDDSRHSPNSIRLSWNAVPNATIYRLEQRKGTTGSFVRVGQDTANTLKMAENLECGTAYYFRVRARGDGTTYSTSFGNASPAKMASTSDCPEVSVSAGTSTVNVGESAQFTLTASYASAADLVVRIRVTETGSALSGTKPTSKTILEDELSTSFDLGTDSDGTVKVAVLSGSGYTVGSNGSATVTVTDLPQITISPHSTASQGVTEGRDVVFVLSLNPTPMADLTVKLSVTEMGSFLKYMAPTQMTIGNGSRTAHLTLETVNDAIDEMHGTIDAEILSDTGYRVGTPSSASISVEDDDVSLDAPVNLTISPWSQRRAKLTWTGDPNAANDSNPADDYAVQVRRPGRTEWQNPNLREQSGTSAVILLDVIWEEYSDATPPVLLESGGLVNLTDNVDYEYRVKALYDTDVADTSDPYVDSDWSKPVALMDTPITSINGISTGDDGQALVKWSRVPGAVKYKLRWRRIPAASESTEVWETLTLRMPDNEWHPTYAESDSDWSDFEEAESGKLEHPLTGLNVADIYAVQLVYERYNERDGPSERELIDGFSGRESFVWPWPSTKKFPNDGAKVATYPFLGHWPSKEYRYSICSDTFVGNWDSLISNAFKQWDKATGLVTTTHVTLDCEVDDDVPFSLFKGIYNDRNEVYRVDTSDERIAYIRAYANNMMSVPEGAGTPYLCIFFALSCTVSPVDDDHPRYAGRLHIPSRFARDELPGFYRDGPLGSVDVLVSQDRDNTRLDIPIAVRFNTCIGAPWHDFTNYELMVHEAGHALGLASRLSWINPWEFYARDHSTIQDSVMNYDELIPDNKLTDGTYRDEMDCAPHPFDIMAIYALYQGVN